MNCKEFAAIKEKYLQGTTTDSEEKQIETHLESCPACKKAFDQLLSETENSRIKPPATYFDTFEELDDGKQKKILRRAKYKNRFSMAVFLLLLFAVFQIAGTFISSIFFTAGGENSRIYKTQRTAALLIESTFPNVTMPARSMSHFFSGAGFGHSTIYIKPYLAAFGEFALQKQVGKDKQVIGYLHINQLFSFMNTVWQWQNGSYDYYLYFYHPDQISDYYLEQNNIIWETLEKLPEGTVGELAVSFKQTLTIAEAMQLLSNFDLDITWYAVETGFEKNNRSGDHASPLSAFSGIWGVPHSSTHMLSQYSSISSQDSGVRENYLLDSLEFLLKNERIAKKVYRGNPQELKLDERCAYVKKHGVNVYGVVVTGPSKELLKLKEIENIRFPALGEIQLWNWYNRNFSATMY